VDVSLVAAVVSALVGLAASALTSFSALSSRKRESERTLEQRLADLGDLMRSSAQILEQVQAEIQARVALATKAKQDAEEAERIAELNEAQRVAVARLVRAELTTEFAKTSRRSFWQGFIVNFLFFVGGAVVSVITTLWLGR
jgi:hypothetical protein